MKEEILKIIKNSLDENLTANYKESDLRNGIDVWIDGKEDFLNDIDSKLKELFHNL